MGRFLSKIDLRALKKVEEIFNSRLKRGEIDDPKNIVQTQHVVCGCGAKGCCFISVTRKKVENEK